VLYLAIFFLNHIPCRVREWTHVAPVLRVSEEGKPCCWEEILNNRATIEAIVLAKETKHSLPAICGWLLHIRQFLLLEKKYIYYQFF
jgi:hypothetical protein